MPAVTPSGSIKCWRSIRSIRRSPHALHARSIAGASSLRIDKLRRRAHWRITCTSSAFARRVRDRLGKSLALSSHARSERMMKLSLTHYLIRCEREHGIDSGPAAAARNGRARARHQSRRRQRRVGQRAGQREHDQHPGRSAKEARRMSNEILFKASCWGGFLAGMASEEMDAPMGIPVAIRAENICCCSTRSTARAMSTSTFRSALFFGAAWPVERRRTR